MMKEGTVGEDENNDHNHIRFVEFHKPYKVVGLCACTFVRLHLPNLNLHVTHFPRITHFQSETRPPIRVSTLRRLEGVLSYHNDIVAAHISFEIQESRTPISVKQW